MYKEKTYIENFYRNLKYKDNIRIVRDLSQGKMQEDMIQEMNVRVFPSNKRQILKILQAFPIIELEVLKY